MWDDVGRKLHPLLDLVDQVYGEVVVHREPVQSQSLKALYATVFRYPQGFVNVRPSEGKVPELMRCAVRRLPFETTGEELSLR